MHCYCKTGGADRSENNDRKIQSSYILIDNAGKLYLLDDHNEKMDYTDVMSINALPNINYFNPPRPSDIYSAVVLQRGYLFP